jgi:hypothetical protein
MIKQLVNNEILLELIEKGFSVILKKDGVVLEDFYKSGTVRLEPQEDGTFRAHSRYEQVDGIESLDDLVYLNYEWWQKSKNRSDSWLKPDELWAKEMVRLGIIKRKEEMVVSYE